MRLPTLFSERCHKASHALFKSAVIPHFTFFVGCGICFFPFFSNLPPATSFPTRRPTPQPCHSESRVVCAIRNLLFAEPVISTGAAVFFRLPRVEPRGAFGF